MSEPATRLILASGSPRRSELLAQYGFVFDVIAADIDESMYPGESPETYVERLAREKAMAVRARVEPTSGESIVIGADTTVALGTDILGKPANAAETKTMLRSLSGATHQVFTGVAVVREEPISLCVRTNVTFAELTDHEIDWYVSTGEAFDKAGGYGIQGAAGAFVERIDGNVQNVVGLPMHHLVLLLARVGIRPQMLRAT